MDVVEITELEKIDADRVDGVGAPASGIPILLMKTVAEPAADLPDGDAAKADGDGDGGKVNCPTCKGDGKVMGDKRDCPDCDATGKVTPAKAKTLAAKSLVRDIIAKAVDRKGNVDETPDVAGGTAVLAQIADLIIAEAQELKAGQAGEISDILQLACAAEAIWCWRTGEEAVSTGSVMPATALMQSALETPDDLAATRDRIIDGILKAKHSAANRRKLAEQGNALSDGSYPIADEHDLKSAAILAQSGHGDVEGAKRLISRRAKELGVKNPLEDSDDDKDDTAKGRIAPEGDGVDTVTQGTGDLQKVVEDAVAKATAPLEKLRRELEDAIAKALATPVPGGPVLSRNVQVKQAGAVVREDWAAKAAHYREMAEQVTDRSTADGYRKLAREADAKAVTPPAS